MMQQEEKSQIQYRSADTFAVDELVATLNRCFEGYLFPVRFDRQNVFKMVRVDGADLSASVVIQYEGKIAGVALIARRGWNCRLASMSIDPNFRGKRIGTMLTEFLIGAARERGDRHCVLEVIEQNEPALRLYQSAGFVPVRRLLGYSTEAIEGKEDAALEEVDPVDVGVAVSRWGVDDPPWQISPHTLTALGPPHRAFRLGPAAATISNPAAESITLCALVVDSSARRQGQATWLLRALSARFPGKKWKAPILVPEEIPETFFTRLNFRKERLTQLQMARQL
jgi:ribosomal protein S18 acetylase RimI-like enzyme